ncbi:cytochrome c oxidase subunit 3 [Microvirga sp. VF16]|uniref:cytochrome c oxidase subunit 3 n=1 Tax=Microvirga sp. VF16 TaxID=2807101 RepID=UPI00193D00AD|nr:cytochrome c oxidase subunit 3 [Microvirga sp. VF16]QRM30932.1 cytochrome c oxidase subunit 3 [Microvirga sp. VF16]
MGSILLFLSVLAVIGAWWLSRQGLASKPWLEQGTASTLPEGNITPTPPSKIGLNVFLAVVGSLFALFISAYAMRMQLPDWRTVPVPTILWLNTVMLALSSVALHGAKRAAARGEMPELRLGLLAAGISALAFLSGQLLAWRQLSNEGYLLAANPANAFFYVLTGMHGLHLLGGLVALGRTAEKAWRETVAERLRLSVDLCATYWHFLLLVWLVFLSVLTGWAGEFVDICRQLLT